MPSTVYTGNYSIKDVCSHWTFYAEGRYWAFWYDYDYGRMRFSSSTDGSTWSSPTTVSINDNICPDSNRFDVYFDGSYIHFACACGSAIYYKRGTPNSDGTITWGSDQTVHTDYDDAINPMVRADSNHYVWIGYSDRPTGESSRRPYVIKSGNNDGTWGTTPTGFPHQLSTTLTEWIVIPVPLTNQKILALYTSDMVHASCWNGSSWNDEIILESPCVWDIFEVSVTPQDDDVHIVFRDSDLNIQYMKYNYSSNSFSSLTTLCSTDTGCAASISRNVSSNDLYVFLESTNTIENFQAYHIYYKKYDAITESWGNWTDWINESSNAIDFYEFGTYYWSINNEIGILYDIEHSEGIYWLRFDKLSVSGGNNVSKTVTESFGFLDYEESKSVINKTVIAYENLEMFDSLKMVENGTITIVIKNIVEKIGLAESHTVNLVKDILEKIGLKDIQNKKLVKLFKEKIGLKDVKNAKPIKILKEKLGLIDTTSYSVTQANPTLVSVNGNVLDFIIDFERVIRNYTQFPQWINQPPELITSFWNKQIYKVTYTCRMTDLEKWTFNQLLLAHSWVYLVDLVHEIETNAFFIEMESEWKGEINWEKPWEVSLTFIYTQ